MTRKLSLLAKERICPLNNSVFPENIFIQEGKGQYGYNEILSHLKKNTICKNRNGLREYYTKGSKSEKEKYCMIYHLK